MDGRLGFAVVAGRSGFAGAQLVARAGRCDRRNGTAFRRGWRNVSMSSSSDPLVRPNIVVLGGGFGGLYTALHLLNLPWSRLQQPKITLVDRSDRFVFLPLLYELVSGSMSSSEIAPYFSELLSSTNVKFLQGSVKKVDPSKKAVYVGQDDEDFVDIPYDRLVVAVGASSALDIVPGARIDDAVRLKERLRDLRDSDLSTIKVAVVGGGYSGVELCATMAEILGDRASITLLSKTDKILPSANDFTRQIAEQALERLGVALELDSSVDRIDEKAVIFTNAKDSRETLEADLILCTAGAKPNALKGLESLPMNNRGQIKTTKSLQVEGMPEIFALGDVAECIDQSTKTPTTSTAQGAMQQADYASFNIYASIAQEPSLSYRYLNLGEMLALGDRDASVSALGNLNLSGKAAVAMRRAVYLARMPTDLHRLKTAASMASRPIVYKANQSVADLLRNVL